MGVIRSLVPLAAALFLPAAFAASQSADADIDLASAQPLTLTSSKVIVKFSQAGSAKFKRDDAGESGFYTTLSSAGQKAEPGLSFESEVFHGVSFDLKDAKNQSIAEIEALPEVEKAWYAGIYTLPITGAAEVQAGTNRSAWSTHKDTGVEKMQQLGHKGKDVVIAFVDSGIDYNHPALGGGFGPGYKVSGGWDLVGDNYDVYNSASINPDSDPMDCLGHGTHVAGIASSSDDWLPGVAPEATLRSYKVFGCADGVTEDIIVAGFIRAYEEGADIISASLGSNQGFPDTALALVAASIQEKGVFVSIAAGNSGNVGPFYTSSGGNGQGSTTVGSAQAADLVGYVAQATSSSGEKREISYLASELKDFALDGSISPFVPYGENFWDHDGCDWDGPISPKNSLYLIARGNCYSTLQSNNLLGKASWVFYILNDTEWEYPERYVYGDDRQQASGEAVIQHDDGKWLVDQALAGHNVSVAFTNDHHAISLPRQGYAAGRVNDFSSWGPTLDGRMKPEICAPGGTILSTYPVADGSWAALSGTSMATPFIAGVAAQFLGANGGRQALGSNAAKLTHERIIASGRPLYHNDVSIDGYANVGRQGAGLVDAEKVIAYSTYVSPANINLNDTAHYSGTHTVKITNKGDKPVVYQLSHEAGPTANILGAGTAWVSLEPLLYTGADDVASVSISATEIQVPASATVDIELTFTEPAGIDAIYLPVYGGRVVLAGDNGEVVAVTYMGIKGNLYECDTWEMERGVPLMFSGYGGLIEPGMNYTFAKGSAFPQPYFNVLWGTRELSFDYVERDWQPSDWAYPPVPGKDKWLGSVRQQPSPLDGSVTNYPIKSLPRTGGSFYALSDNVLANGSSIPSGEYKILGRVLRTYGDPSNIEDWQYKTSEWFSIARTNETEPTTTSLPPSSTTAVISVSSTSAATTTAPPPITTCDPSHRPVELQVLVGDTDTNSTKSYPFYGFSDFLAIDLAGTQPPLTSWYYDADSSGSGGRLETSSGVFAAVHTNANSLVYMYASSRVSGAFSFLECAVSEQDGGGGGSVTCTSGEKKHFYICERGDAVVRHGTQVLDGCTPIVIKAAFQDLEVCSGGPSGASTSATITNTSGTVSSEPTASSTVTSSTASSSSTTTSGATSRNCGTVTVTAAPTSTVATSCAQRRTVTVYEN